MEKNLQDPDIDFIEDDEEDIKSDDETIEVDTSSEKSIDDEDELVNEEDDEEDELVNEEDDDEDIDDDGEENIDENNDNNESININNNNILNNEYDSDESDDDDYRKDFMDLKNSSFVHPLMNKTNLYNMKQKCEIIYKYDNNCQCDIINDPNHMTNPLLTKYEKTKVLGLRASQLNNGAEPFIEVDENIIDGYKIAELELKEKKIPFIIQRPLPGGNCEFWKLEDLEQI